MNRNVMSRTRVLGSPIRVAAFCAALVAAGLFSSVQAAMLLHYWDFEDAVNASTGLLADTANNYQESAGAVATPLNANGAQQIVAAGRTGGNAIQWNNYGVYSSNLTDMGSSFTTEWWFKQNSGGTGGNIRLMYGWGGTLGIHLNTANLLGVTVGGNNQNGTSTYVNPGMGSWIYMAVVADAAASTVKVFANTGSGLNEVYSGSTYNGSSSAPTQSFRLGDGSKYAGSAVIDYVAVWNQPLTVQELQSNMTNGPSLTPAPEPAAISMVWIGALGSVACVWRRRRRRGLAREIVVAPA